MNRDFIAIVLAAASLWLAGCSTPSEHTSPAHRANISEIHMTDARHGWAVSYSLPGHERVLHTVDGGASWEDRTPPVAADSEWADGSRGYYDSQHAWISVWGRTKGATGIWGTKDGGKSWSWAPTEFPLREFTFLTADHVVACTWDVGLGSAYYQYYETEDGGARWRLAPIRSPDSGEPVGTIHLCNLCSDRVKYLPPNRVLITSGDMGDEQPKGVVRMSVTSDLGKTWRELSVPLPERDRQAGLVTEAALDFVDSTHGWLSVTIDTNNPKADSFGAAGMAIYVTEDGGETWAFHSELNPNSFGAGNQLPDFHPVSLRDAFINFDNGLQATHDGGKTWRPLRPDLGLGNEPVAWRAAQLDFTDPRHGWMILQGEPGQDRLFKTQDGGATWYQLTPK